MKRDMYLIIVLALAASQALYSQALEEYVRLAAEQNPGLRARYKEVEASLEKAGQVTGWEDPALSFGYFISPIETRVGPQRARLSITQMFPWFGTLKAQGDFAALNAEAQLQEFLWEKNRLKYEVASEYYPLYRLKKWLSLEEENIELLEALKRIATGRFENGQGSLVDVLRSEVLLNEARTRIENLERRRRVQLSRFNTLLNRDREQEVILPDTLVLDEPKPTGFMDSLRQNPRLLSLDYRIRAGESQETVARRKGMPRWGIGLDYVWTDPREDLAGGTRPEGDGRNALVPRLSLSLPFFRGKYRAGQNEARILKERYELERAELENDLASELAEVLLELEEEEARLQLYREQAARTRQVFNLLLTSYRNSGKDFGEVLGTLRELLDYRKKEAEALVGQHLMQARLVFLTSN